MEKNKKKTYLRRFQHLSTTLRTGDGRNDIVIIAAWQQKEKPRHEKRDGAFVKLTPSKLLQQDVLAANGTVVFNGHRITAARHIPGIPIQGIVASLRIFADQFRNHGTIGIHD